MVDKKELIEFLEYLKKVYADNGILHCCVPEQGEGFRELVAVINNDKCGEDTYYELGNSMSSTDTSFSKIAFREDCYDYLLEKGFDSKDAFDLMEGIRKGIFNKPKYDTFRARLDNDFVQWAKGVRYLSGRYIILNIFKMEYEKYQYDNVLPMPRKTRELAELSEVYEKAAKNPETLYAQPFLNWNGSFEDKSLNKCVVITDRVAKWMSRSNILSYVKKIEMPANKTYLVESHTGQPTTDTENSNREEELLAMGLFNKKVYLNSDIHSFVDYQVPICRNANNKQDNTGKIDLISISSQKKEIYLMELKKFDSEETLLRCAAESYTYYSQIDTERLTAEVADKLNLGNSLPYKLIPAVLVFKGQRQHLQYTSDLYANVKELMKNLGIKLFVIESEVACYSEEKQNYIDNCHIKEVVD